MHDVNNTNTDIFQVKESLISLRQSEFDVSESDIGRNEIRTPQYTASHLLYKNEKEDPLQRLSNQKASKLIQSNTRVFDFSQQKVFQNPSSFIQSNDMSKSNDRSQTQSFCMESFDSFALNGVYPSRTIVRQK